MEFCRIPRTFDEVSTLLKDAGSRRSLANPYTDPPLLSERLSGPFGRGWRCFCGMRVGILTEDGAAFLEAHGCC